MIKDDFRGSCWLGTTTSDNAKHTAYVLARWNRVFTTSEIWVSEEGSNFMNEVMKNLATTHRIWHNFTVAFFTWCNGTVEGPMRSILYVLDGRFKTLSLHRKIGQQLTRLSLSLSMNPDLKALDANRMKSLEARLR